ncbi:hypothetical protein [Listeria booriae]|uniref:hypothetical protein n=1 Tax=Listeria booriae TaxID=1552123 RepID=UPI001628E283|nr:hypothetical protein [Listeria booriae]MBC2190537.1 hypothetical protein [Listeria booriae]
MAKTSQKVSLKIGEREFEITIKDKEKEEYKNVIESIRSNIAQANSFESSTEILKEGIELFLGEGSFEQVLEDCEHNILNTMNALFRILEVVENVIYPVEVFTEPDEENEVLPD